MKSNFNFWLIVNPNVVLTPLIDNAIFEADPWFSESGLPCHVSSGLRTPQKQLSLIIEKAVKYGIDKEFPSIVTARLDILESWRLPWGRILQTGEMINPPFPTRAPFDYVRSDGVSRRAGNMIDLSGHQRGEDFDIRQEYHKLEEIAGVLDKILEDENVVDIKGYLLEPKNGAVHVDCKQPKIEKF